MITTFNNFMNESANTSLKTKKQKEVYKYILDEKAIDEDSSITVFGDYFDVAKNLVYKGILNAKIDVNYGFKFWIRQENERQTKMYNIFAAYASSATTNPKIIIDNKIEILIICRYELIYKWKDIRVGLNKLAKVLGLYQYELRLDGGNCDLELWDKTNRPKFDFNGEEFIRVN